MTNKFGFPKSTVKCYRKHNILPKYGYTDDDGTSFIYHSNYILTVIIILGLGHKGFLSLPIVRVYEHSFKIEMRVGIFFPRLVECYNFHLVYIMFISFIEHELLVPLTRITKIFLIKVRIYRQLSFVGYVLYHPDWRTNFLVK